MLRPESVEGFVGRWINDIKRWMLFSGFRVRRLDCSELLLGFWTLNKLILVASNLNKYPLKNKDKKGKQ
jgi:hypothetical protein